MTALLTERSLAQVVADLSEPERAAVLADFDPATLAFDPQFWLRPTQLRPINETDWTLAEMVAGRGAGKTRSMCEWARHKAQGPPTRGALVARTAADVRDVLVAGESGILAVSPPSEKPEYEPSKRLLTWPNGSTALCFSSEAPDQLRGPQFHWALADEIASWKYLPDESGLTAWDNLRLATRLGDHPQIFAGTTPKRTPFMRSLIKAAETESNVLLLRGSTKDNRGNLSQTYIDMIYGLYAGTALAQQELEGIMLDDIDGALWDEALIELHRVQSIPKMKRPIVAVGVDPSVSEKPGDETGIVVAVVDGAIRDMYRRHAYILSDASLQAAPEVWARVLATEAQRFANAPIIAETNQGGGLIKAVLTGIDPGLRVLGVHSRFGKAIRAEPVVLAAQQGRVHHVGYFPELEDQLTSWVPDETRKSPDRLDAYVHVLTALLVKQPEGLWGGGIRAYSPSRRSIPPAPRPRFRGPATSAARRTGGGHVH
jgi:phage terminase large subunit-like protein